MRHIFTILLFANSLTLLAQKQKSKTIQPKLVISALNSNVLYLDKLNLVAFKLEPETNDSLTMTVSQGSCSLFDNNSKEIFSVFPDRKGSLKIKVLKVLRDTQIVVGQKTYNVVLSPEQITLNNLQTKPNLSLASYSSGKIPIDTVKKINCLTMNQNYKLVSSIVYFSSSIGTACTTTTSINDNCFDTNFRKYWSRVSPGTVFTFSQIKIQDIVTKKVFTIPDIGFVVGEK